jgi:hypothetical protein
MQARFGENRGMATGCSFLKGAPIMTKFVMFLMCVVLLSCLGCSSQQTSQGYAGSGTQCTGSRTFFEAYPENWEHQRYQQNIHAAYTLAEAGW